jgi:hypothetical protein
VLHQVTLCEVSSNIGNFSNLKNLVCNVM